MEKLISEISDIRLDQFLVNAGAYPSRGIAVKNIEAGNVTVNGNSTIKKHKVQLDDVVEYQPYVQNDNMESEEIPLDVRFEDEHIMVISKQAGLVCHPAPGHETGTLVNALISHCGKEHLCNLTGDDSRLGIVHRLDGDTSGLMIVAKTNEAGQKLQLDMQNHTTLRRYKALVFGNMKYNTGKIDVPLLRTIGRNNRPKMAGSDDPRSKNAITTFTTTHRYEDIQIQGFQNKCSFSVLECKLKTGRTHQIRSHLEYIGFPVVGDPVYDKNVPKGFYAKKYLGLNRQFLHSFNIGFNHPISGEYLEFKDDLPKDLADVKNILDGAQQLQEKAIN